MKIITLHLFAVILIVYSPSLSAHEARIDNRLHRCIHSEWSEFGGFDCNGKPHHLDRFQFQQRDEQEVDILVEIMAKASLDCLGGAGSANTQRIRRRIARDGLGMRVAEALFQDIIAVSIQRIVERCGRTNCPPRGFWSTNSGRALARSSATVGGVRNTADRARDDLRQACNNN